MLGVHDSDCRVVDTLPCIVTHCVLELEHSTRQAISGLKERGKRPGKHRLTSNKQQV